MSTFQYGEYRYQYELVYEERKTLSLTVYPSMVLLVRAPFAASQERIELFLKRKWLWLDRQLRAFAAYKRETYKQEYVSGEGFLYLGRLHTLQVREAKSDSVQQLRGRLVITTRLGAKEPDYTKLVLQRWYRQRAATVFYAQYKKVARQFNYTTLPALSIKRIQKKWGNYSPQNIITLNPELIKAPIACIDYVIFHELCHVTHPDHGKQFYALLEEKCPTWRKQKEKLEVMLC